MTREEAKQWLEAMKSAYALPIETYEALDMAIKALSVANLKEEFESAVPNCQKCAIKELWKATEKEDLVSVVRCKDCRYWEYVQDDGDCIRHTDDTLGYAIQANADDFCSYGERREP